MVFRRLSCSILIAVASWTAAGSLLEAASAVGMVLQAKGKAELVRAGAKQPLRIADSLEPGDRISALEGQVVFLFCPTSETLTMPQGSTVALTNDSVAVVSGPGLQKRNARRCSIPEVALGSESLERVGGLRARGYPPIPIFLGGPVSTTHPVFQWAQLEGNPGYELIVKNDLGAQVWKKELSGVDQLAYPDSAPALAAGHYAWELTARSGGRVVGQQSARFEVKPDPELSADTPQDTPSRIMAATALENAGYYAQAASLYRDLRKENPNDPRLTRRLAWLYWKAGLIAAANAERKRIDEGR